MSTIHKKIISICFLGLLALSPINIIARTDYPYGAMFFPHESILSYEIMNSITTRCGELLAAVTKEAIQDKINDMTQLAESIAQRKIYERIDMIVAFEKFYNYCQLNPNSLVINALFQLIKSTPVDNQVRPDAFNRPPKPEARGMDNNANRHNNTNRSHFGSIRFID